MLVSSITSIQNNNTVFNRRPAVKPVEPKLERPMNMEDKMVLGMKCLGIIGAAAVTNVILKENGYDVFKMAKNGIKSLTNNSTDIQRAGSAAK